MTWTVQDKEFEAVTALPGQGRYEYFVKRVGDWEEVWALGSEDELLTATDDAGSELLPLWPHPRYAEACASGEWAGASPVLIGREELEHSLLPQLVERQQLVAVFPTPLEQAVHVAPETIRADLASEASKYE